MLVTILSLFLLFSCGTPSLLKDVEESEPHVAAARALENDDPDTAIELMEKELESDPSNYNYISILASAKAQKAGVDMVTLILKLADQDESDDQGEMELLFTVLPTPSADSGGNIELLQEAIDGMTSIPTANQSTADILKHTIFLTAMSALRAKLLDTDGDGELSTEELLALDVSSAASIIANIGDAASVVAGFTGTDSENLAADKVNEILADINSESGSDSAEQLRNYLGQ